MEFLAVDVETANADMASICQVGIARYRNGGFEGWKTYVDPQDYFDPINVSIHGIDEDTVRGAPTFRDVAAGLLSALNGNTVVSHMPFDKTAIGRACLRDGFPVPACRWLDSARVVRRTWSEFSRSGYGLQNVCESLGYSYQAHDALEDAKAAAHVILRAIEETGLTLEDWLTKSLQPLHSNLNRCGNPAGPLYGEVLVFTGQLMVDRATATEQATAILGCDVPKTVTKKTTILVVGDQDVRKLAGKDKSLKHLRAEELIREGNQVQVLSEADFVHLLDLAQAGGAA